MADLAIELEGLDTDINDVNEMMSRIVADDVTSDTALIMVVFNSQENVWVKGSAPIIIQPPKRDINEPEPDIKLIGMHTEFSDPMLWKETLTAAFPVSPTLLIKILTLLRGELGKEQKKLDIKMSKLISIKKGQPN